MAVVFNIFNSLSDIFDSFSGNYRNESKSANVLRRESLDIRPKGLVSDKKNIQSDWHVVGKDSKKSVKKVKAKYDLA